MSVASTIGQKVHCSALDSKSGVTGVLSLNEDEQFEANLFGYGSQIDVEPHAPVFLQTKDLDIVSLHNNYGPPVPGRAGMGKTADPDKSTVVFNLHVLSNDAVIGPDRWLASDVIKSVRFHIVHAEALLKHKGLSDKLLNAKMTDVFGIGRELFRVSGGGITVAVEYGLSFSFENEYPRQLAPFVTVDFEQSQNLESYLSYLASVVRFFSIALSAHLRPSKIEISRHSSAEFIASKEPERLTRHTALHRWTDTEIDQRDLWAGHSFVIAWDDDELDALKQCLGEWISRDAAWRIADSFMMTSLKLRNVNSGERLLNACKWLDAIPAAESQQTIAASDIDAISNAASAKATALGHTDMSDRISGALKGIGIERRRGRFERLLRDIASRFGDHRLGKDALDDLMQAHKLRGKSAHTGLTLDDLDDTNRFSLSTHAMEALCYLLTLKDLPMTQAGMDRVARNPFVMNYHHHRRALAGE